MAETDYNEILLEAIDAIVVSRISEVNFDRTIVATIVDASKAKDGEYVLSDGSVQFTAHSGNDKYKENDRVNVLIPSNDFSSTEKTILGKTSANINDVPITYVSPLEKIVPMETNYAAGLKGGIIANGETEIFQLTNAEWVKVNESTLGYDTLCVSARFKTLLNDYDIRQGHYGLLVQLKTKNGYIHALTLDSAKDMFGNPYGYSMYLTQEQTYHLNLQDNIIGIKIDLYQMKDFKYNDGVNSELQVLPVMPYSNILVDNINVSFGYNAEQVEDNTVKIGTADSLTYNNIKDASVTKKLTLTWYNKNEDNKYLGFTDGAFADLSAAQTAGSQKYYIKWVHSLNNGQWEEIQETGQEQELTVNLNMAWGLNEYRAIVVFDGVSYTSNIIQFKNATGIDNPQERLQMLLTLHNVVDSSYDSYPLYGSDGVVINPLDATQNRKVYFSYSSEIGGNLEPDVLKGATAYFYIPQNSTMLEVPGGETNWDDDQDSDHSKTGYVAYVKRFSKEQTEPTVEEKTFLYRIKANYNPLFTNNKVILRVVDKNGFIYETSKTFAFSSYGTSGTDYSIVISGINGENGWVGSNGFIPKAQLYDANYKEIADIDWTWSKYPTGTTINANQPLNSTTTLYQAIKAKTAISWVGKNVQISGIYSIPYSADEDYMYQGPTTIIYNSNGVKPSYYNGDLGIFKKSDNSEVACTWSIEYFTKSNVAVSGNKEPWLSWGELTDTTDGRTRFKPSSMYLGDTYYLVLVAKNKATILWRQPLIILQNQYASGLLNNWDGNLVVDNESNYILSSMMGAGSKDGQNRFSGILMGEVSKVADKSAETGLFGYHEGAQSFGFKTDGTAFIGQSGVGRIHFDGNNGAIASPGWVNTDGSIKKITNVNSAPSGVKIDFANSQLYLKNNNGEYLCFVPSESNQNTLQLGIKGANIKLIDEGNKSITGYIAATAEGLTTEFKKTTNYAGVCESAKDASEKVVANTGISGDINSGLSLSVKFTHGNTVKEGVKFKINNTTYNVSGAPECIAGETLPFVFDGKNFVLTSVSSSKITQTATAITSMVSDLSGKVTTVTQTAESIEAEFKTTGRVGKLETSVDGLTAEFKADGKVGKLEVSVEGIKSSINGANGLSSRIQQNADSIKNKVSNTVTGSSCSWSLTESGFYVNKGSAAASASNYVLKVDGDGLSINGSGTFSGSIAIGGTTNNPNFKVDTNGNVTLNGNITWGSGASPTQVVYARTAISKPANGTKYSSFAASSATTWHTSLDSTNDKFASYTYDAGATWTSTMLIAGKDGVGVSKIEQTTTSTVSGGKNIFKVTLTDGSTSEFHVLNGAQGGRGTSITIKSIDYTTSSSNTTAPSSGWSTTIPTTSGTSPYLWQRVTYSDNSKAYTCLKGTVTKSELWGFLGANDGIYKDTNGNIAIRATAIASGAIQIGSKFYAGMDDNVVTIGGFTIGTETISGKQLYLSSGSPTGNGAVLRVANGAFQVDTQGKVTATSITIGGYTISSGTTYIKIGNVYIYPSGVTYSYSGATSKTAHFGFGAKYLPDTYFELP